MVFRSSFIQATYRNCSFINEVLAPALFSESGAVFGDSDQIILNKKVFDARNTRNFINFNFVAVQDS